MAYIEQGRVTLYTKSIERTTTRVYCNRKGEVLCHIYSLEKSQRFRETEYGVILRTLKSNGCAICGYRKHIDILEFHHVNPKLKKYNVRKSTIARNNLVEELAKCLLLCPNCHKEVHLKMELMK